MIKKTLYLLSSISFIACSNLKPSTKNSDILLQKNGLPENYSYSFPFNVKTDINDSLYDLIKDSNNKAEYYAKHYLPKGIQELKDKFALEKWSIDSIKTVCKQSKYFANENCKMTINSDWSEEISTKNSDHFLDLIKNLDPDYKDTYNYRFRILAIVKVYVDDQKKNVYYDTQLFLDVERKGTSASAKHFKPLSTIKKIGGQKLAREINKILYSYYLKWIDDEIGPRKK